MGESTQNLTNALSAEAPFDDPQADIILRSGGSSTVDFRTYKHYLSTASPIFEDMAAFPQRRPDSSLSNVLIVQMQEGEHDLRSLLLFCHPGTLPDLPTNLNQLYRLASLAEKYMLDFATAWVRKLSHPIITTTPIGGYIVARKFQWKEEAEIAARQCLTLSLDKIIAWHDPILCDAPASFFQDLLWYHRTCSEVLSAYTRPIRWKRDWYAQDREPPGFIYSTYFYTYDEPSFCCSGDTYENGGAAMYSKQWWEIFMSGLSKDLSHIPSFDVVLTPQSFNAAMAEAIKCEQCRSIALDALSTFADRVASQALDRIKLVRS